MSILSKLLKTISATILLSIILVGCKKQETAQEVDSRLTVTTKDVTEITSSSAKCGGIVTVSGNYSIGMCGICWAESPSPTINNYFTTDIQGAGEYVSNMRNLKSNTNYYVRAYAITSSGNMYGKELCFKTLQNGGGGGGSQNDSLPVVQIVDVKDITNNSATCYGNAISDGGSEITERGVCWGTSENPMIHNFHVSCGSGTGSFDAQITGLSENTVYYARTYAINKNGTAYSNGSIAFTTSHTIYMPTVTTGDITHIGQSSATCTLNVTSNGNDQILYCGICYGIYQNPSITDSHTNVGNDTGEYSSELTSLTANTLYYYRAYATNSKGTAYGAQKTFRTLDLNEYDVYGIRFKMIRVNGGSFYMGAQNNNSNETNYFNTTSTSINNSEPVHQVMLATYYIGKYEVTQELWNAVMGNNPSYHQGDIQQPVENVTWNECQTFLQRLNNITGESFRLPTEAEWEFAARSRNSSANNFYSGCNSNYSLSQYAWWAENSSETTHPVGMLQPNSLGIYDMSGNVWEWCSDWYGSYSSSLQTNPTGPTTGTERVMRGGGYGDQEWLGYVYGCAIWSRSKDYPNQPKRITGLRLAKSN